jgi:hypothetical protein
MRLPAQFATNKDKCRPISVVSQRYSNRISCVPESTSIPAVTAIGVRHDIHAECKGVPLRNRIEKLAERVQGKPSTSSARGLRRFSRRGKRKVNTSRLVYCLVRSIGKVQRLLMGSNVARIGSSV